MFHATLSVTMGTDGWRNHCTMRAFFSRILIEDTHALCVPDPGWGKQLWHCRNFITPRKFMAELYQEVPRGLPGGQATCRGSLQLLGLFKRYLHISHFCCLIHETSTCSMFESVETHTFQLNHPLGLGSFPSRNWIVQRNANFYQILRESSTFMLTLS